MFLKDLIMMVGGVGAYNDVELVYLSGNNISCQKPNDFPYTYASIGTFLQNQALVCGGRTSNDYSNSCYVYDRSTNGWKHVFNMTSKRAFATGM
jgi:hypothetical protein